MTEEHDSRPWIERHFADLKRGMSDCKECKGCGYVPDGEGYKKCKCHIGVVKRRALDFHLED